MQKKEVKVEGSKDYTSYGVLGIVAVVAIVGLVLLFSERLELSKESISSDNSEDITGSFTIFSKQDCISSSTRPCYDKQTGKKIIGLEPKGGEKAFAACLKSKVIGSSGSYTAETPICDEEKFLYCYEGKSKVFLRKFEGVCGETQTIPQPLLNCPRIEEFYPLSFLDTSWSMKDPTSYYFITTLLKSSSGALFAAGFRMEYISADISYGGWIPIMYKSTDNGASWNSVELPYLDDSANIGWNMVWSMVEDHNGAIYAGGTRLWKSADNGNTWSVSPMPPMPAYLKSSYWTSWEITTMTITNDNSLIAAFGFSYNIPVEVHKTADDGKTWQKLFGHSTYISSIVEARDGSLVFRDYPPAPSSVYRYSNGITTKTFTDGPVANDFNADLLKASDEAIYIISVDKSADINLVDYTQPGTAFLAAYKSTDNGMTWNKLGVLPNSWDIKGKIVEAADGTLYVTSYSPCYGGYTIYKSADRGATWSVIAAPPRDFTRGRIEYYYGFNIYSLAEVSGKVLIVGNAPVIFSTP